jgi:hypothetical protein
MNRHLRTLNLRAMTERESKNICKGVSANEVRGIARSSGR